MNPSQEAYINGARFAHVNVTRYGMSAVVDTINALETGLSRARKPDAAQAFLAGAVDTLLAITQAA